MPRASGVPRSCASFLFLLSSQPPGVPPPSPSPGYVISGCRFALGSFMAISTVSLEYCRYQHKQQQEAVRATMDALNSARYCCSGEAHTARVQRPAPADTHAHLTHTPKSQFPIAVQKTNRGNRCRRDPAPQGVNLKRQPEVNEPSSGVKRPSRQAALGYLSSTPPWRRWPGQCSA